LRVDGRQTSAAYHAPVPDRFLVFGASLLPAAAILGVLVPFMAVDPADGFTFSNSPFTDEGWWLANARNFAHFGTWSTDDWNLHLVSPVYSALQAATFSVAGVDIIHARLVVIAAVALTCVALAFGLRRTFGTTRSVVAALGFGFSPLVLYYGRLAYNEPVVAFALTSGALLVVGGDSRPWSRGALSGALMALAIGAKPTALPLVAGMVVATVALGGWRSPWTRRWASAVAAVVVAGAAVWTLLVIVPQRDAFAVVTRILAAQTLPAGADDLLYRILSYPLSNDLALLYNLPLVGGSAAGIALAWSRWSSLPPGTRRLVALSVGWLVAGIGLLMVVPYRPNRYFLPLVPAMAVLTAAALFLWSQPDRDSRRIARLRARLPRFDARAATAVAAALLVVPGLALHAAMMATGSRELVALQESVAAELPPAAVVEGAYAPLLAFPAPVIALVSRPETGVNAGDLYAAHGVRWVVVEDGRAPAWAVDHAAEWDARRTVLCRHWGRSELCLVNVP
jgi:4-amino-4-deoxy-L-arabinose transferase-like glycosyltransferase